ncbi:MAG: Ribosomal RNA small subunit methyltransferase I [bacterium ADurb.Bin400]|nr:MAG: Ribosomal RNA small subunit methyltransferase I [bacterium ADurb.Bin400]
MGTLYVIATPIGNLEDITLRAIRVLREVNLIACEDTRVTRHLLDHYEIKTPTVSYFQHSKLSKIDYLVEQLRQGKNVALVSDAGTPGISDPGQALIGYLRQELPEVAVLPIPGPSAVAAAASVAGTIEKEFYFAGFLPKKKGRQTKFKMLSKLETPIVIYESALRLERTLSDIQSHFGDEVEIFIAREMTKMFEEYWTGRISEVIRDLSNHKLKGEVVLIVGHGGAKQAEGD